MRGAIQEGSNPFEGPRSRPYPNPPQKQGSGHVLWAKAARELGYKPFPQPSGNMWQAYLNPLGIRVAPCTYCGFWNGSAAPIIRRPACKPRFCRRSCAMSAEIEDGRCRRLLANLKSGDGGSRIQQRWGRTPMAAATAAQGQPLPTGIYLVCAARSCL